jgi:hypothetical protein
MARAIFSPQTWLTAGAYFGLLSGIYSFGLFVSSANPSNPEYDLSDNDLAPNYHPRPQLLG